MKKLLTIGKRALIGTLVCGSLFGGTVQAEPTEADRGMAALREAVLTPSKPDTRIFRENVVFFLPMAHADLHFLGQTTKDSLRLSGSLSIVGTSRDGDTTDIKIPFYIDQNKNDMTIYFSADGKWKKFRTPSLAAIAMDTIATPTDKNNEETISLVKEVTLFRETDTNRTMLVKLDGNRVADLIQNYSKNNPADKGTADDGKFQADLTRCIEQGLRKSEPWYIWTIDKTDWQTITMYYNFSEVLQEAARTALSEPSAEFGAMTDVLETLAYYSDLRLYSAFLNPDAKVKLELPKEAKNAVAVDDIIPDEIPENEE